MIFQGLRSSSRRKNANAITSRSGDLPSIRQFVTSPFARIRCTAYVYIMRNLTIEIGDEKEKPLLNPLAANERIGRDY